MSMNQKPVRFFEAHCSNCNETFGIPLLSDFASGEFILQTEDGIAFAYLNAVEDKHFDLISNLFTECSLSEIDRGVQKTSLGFVSRILTKRKKQGEENSAFSAASLNRLHWVIAQCADELHGTKLSNQFRCPKCGSMNVLYGDAVVVRDDEIPIVSFNGFHALSESERLARVRMLYNRSKGLF